MMFRTKLLAALTTWSALAVAGPFDALQRDVNATHTPIITAPETVKAGEAFDVTIAVGATAHPSLADHFVRNIALYAGDVELARVELTPTLTTPRVTLTVTLHQTAVLRALATPNHSAAWVAEKPVTVIAEQAPRQ